MENVLTKIVEIEQATRHQYHYRHRHQLANVAPIIINRLCCWTDQVFSVLISICVYIVYNTLIVLLSFENFQSIQLFKLEFNALKISIKKLTFFGSTLDLWLRWDWPIYFSGCRNLGATAKLIRISVPVINRCFFLIQVRSVVMS